VALLIARVLSAAIIVFRAILDVMKIFGVRRRTRVIASSDYFDPYE
jgi:hypothetical protein